MSVFIWLLLTVFLDFFKNKKYDDLFYNKLNIGYIYFVYSFYRFLIYLVCKKILLLNYKSIKKLIAIWPKMFYTNAILFDIADTEKHDFVNCKVLEFKKKEKTVDSFEFTKLKNFKLKKIKLKKINVKNTIKNLILNSVENNLRFFLKKKSTIFFLRKQKCFNKGRYSRNRQLYRTGVY